MNVRIRIIELIGNWLKNSFMRIPKTTKILQDLIDIFAHAKSEIWQNQSNFFAPWV